ncbi:MAG: hypothetical protein RLZZ435_498 [Cyanobacteriota bacterium]|jgi:integrase
MWINCWGRTIPQFSWDDYLTPKGERQELAEAIELFYQDYIIKGGNQENWKRRYLPTLNKLSSLTPSELIRVVSSTSPDSRNRQIYYDVVNKLAKFLRVSVDLESLRGNYTPTPRNIPSDEEIAQGYDLIPNPSWKWVYGMMSTYGLRNHEVFRIDSYSYPRISLRENTKTGKRDCYPCLESWIDLWNLTQINLPSVNLEQSNRSIGERVARQFKRYGLPFSPYNLRHAYAIRTIREGWPHVLAARSMGHSLATHNRQYHRWITSQQDQEIYEQIMKQKSNPKI